MKSVCIRLILDLSEFSQNFIIVVKDEATADATWVYNIQLRNDVMWQSLREGWSYIGVGLLALLVWTTMGNARSLGRSDGQLAQTPRFHFTKGHLLNTFVGRGVADANWLYVPDQAAGVPHLEFFVLPFQAWLKDFYCHTYTYGISWVTFDGN